MQLVEHIKKIMALIPRFVRTRTGYPKRTTFGWGKKIAIQDLHAIYFEHVLQINFKLN